MLKRTKRDPPKSPTLYPGHGPPPPHCHLGAPGLDFYRLWDDFLPTWILGWNFDGFWLNFGIDFLIFSMNSASLLRGCFWTEFSMNNPHFSNFWFFGNVILTWVKLMILHNQQAVPRLQIHRFVHDYLRNFCIGISCFFMFFRYRFWNWFLIAFLMKNNSKWHPKSIPGVTFSAKMAPKSYDPELRGASWSRPFSSIKILMTFWSHFRPFCSPLDPSWLTLGAFWLHFWSFWLHFACTSYIWPRCWSNLDSISAGAFFSHIISSQTHKRTHPRNTK